jgi:hypothetical protein
LLAAVGGLLGRHQDSGSDPEEQEAAGVHAMERCVVQGNKACYGALCCEASRAKLDVGGKPAGLPARDRQHDRVRIRIRSQMAGF